jgi:hypothetical protein
MHLRVILDRGPESYSATEEQQLRECLASAPSVASITKIEQHVRGGYSVAVDLSGAADEFIAHLSAAGYRPVL